MLLSRLLAPALLVLALPVAHAQTSISLGLRLGLNAATRSGTEPLYQAYSIGSNPPPIYVQDYHRNALLAPQFGVVAEVSFGRLAIQPAVLLSQKVVDQRLTITSSYSSTYATNRSSDEYHTISRPNYLEIPINFVFTTGRDHGFQVFSGPYVVFGLGGRAEYEGQGSSGSTNSQGGTFYKNNYWDYGNTTIIYKYDFPGPPASFVQGSSSSSVFSVGTTPFAASSGYAVARRFDAGLNAGVGYRQGPLQVQLGYGLGLINQQPTKSAIQRDDLPAYYQRVIQLSATYLLKVK
ncbi:MAG: PorT family protein [Bacteroidota bacterium]|nr:PorT family protein [Bacteroidota bacterium]